jgi:ketosteroid isomerase-like protein
MFARCLRSGDGPVSDDLDAVIEESHRAHDAFFKGDPEPVKPFFSQRDDVTLANPFGSVRRGWSEVEKTMERAAANYRDGGVVGFEEVSRYVTPELAHIVEVERYRAKVGGSEEVTPVSLRCTTIFRREGDSWRIVHRHADPITAARPAESVIRN